MGQADDWKRQWLADLARMRGKAGMTSAHAFEPGQTPDAAPVKVEVDDISDTVPEPENVKLPNREEMGTNNLVEIKHPDKNNFVEKMLWSELRDSAYYVDNGILRLTAKVTNWLTLEVPSMTLEFTGGRKLTIPRKSVYVGSRGRAESYEKRSGVIVPLNDQGQPAYDLNNTPHVVLCENWIRDELLRRSADRVKIAELVNTFAKIIQMGAGHAGTVKSGSVGPKIVPKGNYQVGRGPGGKGVNIRPAGLGPNSGGGKPGGSTGTPKGSKPNATKAPPPTPGKPGSPPKATTNTGSGSPGGGQRGGAGVKPPKPVVLDEDGLPHTSMRLEESKGTKRPTGGGTGKQTVKRNTTVDRDSHKGGGKGTGKPVAKKGGSGNKGGADEKARRVVNNKDSDTGEPGKDGGKGTGKPTEKKGEPARTGKETGSKTTSDGTTPAPGGSAPKATPPAKPLPKGKAEYLTADQLNQEVPMLKHLKGDKRRLEKPERKVANEIQAALKESEKGNEAPLNKLKKDFYEHTHDGGEMNGWTSLDLVTGNPGGLNQMRLFFRRVEGGYQVKVRQVHGGDYKADSKQGPKRPS